MGCRLAQPVRIIERCGGGDAALCQITMTTCCMLTFVAQQYVVQTGALLRASHEGDLDKVCALLQEGVPVDSSNSVRTTRDPLSYSTHFTCVISSLLLTSHLLWPQTDLLSFLAQRFVVFDSKQMYCTLHMGARTQV